VNDLERRKFELHAETDDYQERIEQAKDWIHYVFRVCENPCLNYSGGKDSLVLLHLTAAACGYDDVDIYHFDNGLLRVPGSDDFVRKSVDQIGGNLYVRTSEAANSEEMVLEEGHGYNGFWGNYFQLAHERDWDVRLLGIRAAESRSRRDRFDSSGDQPPINWHEDHTAAAPIHHFTTRDVWAYIVENGLEYHEIYDKQGALYGDMEACGNRLVTLYDAEFDSLGAREISQFLYPSETNELKDIEQQ
jgi:3'-phosphoadenosine 5'-phosphosulfate sulfotransferase (PAPS reductase)/FAD synthetase